MDMHVVAAGTQLGVGQSGFFPCQRRALTEQTGVIHELAKPSSPRRNAGAQSEQTRRRPGVARGAWEMLLFPMGCVGLRQAAWVSSGVPSTEVTQTELTEESNT